MAKSYTEIKQTDRQTDALVIVMTVLMEVKGRKGHELNTGQSTGHVRCVCVCMCAHVCMRVFPTENFCFKHSKNVGYKKGHGSALGLRNHSTTQDI